MPSRQILVESPIKDTSVAQVASPSRTTPTTNVPPVTTDDATILITSGEMDKLFHEWDASGQNDLFVNPTLAERIRQYLAYQEELDPLKEQLAERIYKPYLVDVSTANYRNFTISVNNSTVVETSCYLYNGYYKIISVSSFKCILAHIRNPYAPYINGMSNEYVDFCAYVIANGGSFVFDNGWHITL